jgi:ADP-ribose pyrophosphatase
MNKLFLSTLTALCLTTANSYGASAETTTDVGVIAALSTVDSKQIKALSKVDFTQYAGVLSKYAKLKSTNKNFGMGVRTTYPDSPARDALKAGENPSPYDPVAFTAPVVLENAWKSDKKNGWADPANPKEIDKQVAEEGRQRTVTYGKSLSGLEFELDEHGVPMNPMGRTGIKGRGELGLWGPNPAADPIIFRVDNEQLQVLLVQRVDGLTQWAFPGGMVDSTDPTISAAAVRELGEETGLSVQNLQQYSIGLVYRGYVDDARNTDNAWMETNAYAWLLTSDVILKGKIKAHGDREETLAVQWVSVTLELLEDGQLFASHGAILRDAVRALQAKIMGALTGGSASSAS